MIENVVEDYLFNNQGKNLSLKKIQKKLNIKFKKAVYLAINSHHIEIVKPLEVGCNKYFMHLYKYKE
tara:strand:+ start:835 stop:1035 length:201 start_codon:yes stop_codon:yes gene_type:complete